ncbi:MAG: putative proline dehydrogenase/delta-pyrroline-5-carboxylate dehydrogenase [Chlamydiota bacterium]|jgi:RHH-type proline utilization regulon transcriptional repressor/proline dehydrogenase/delta 1-pyrroline-5-carboxylate dehydrogenase
MSKHESASKDLKNATEILKIQKGRPLTEEEREKKAVELASYMLNEANRTMRFSEKVVQQELSRMMRDPMGKAFTMAMTDQCFRSHTSSRVADQMVYLLEQMGIPKYLGFSKKFSLFVFLALGKVFPWFFVNMATFFLRKTTSKVILPGEKGKLKEHMALRRKEGVRLNINHLGEAILGEEEAKQRLRVYLHDLTQDNIEYVSIKISTIYSQIHLLGWEKTLDVLSDRLRQLYRVAMKHKFVRPDGTAVQKFVNLDMEEYRDLHLTKELFQKVLSEEEFLQFSAGIVLQAYLPDSFEIQKELTEWAIERRGAPIKIRIVKGANLAMEQFEASVRGWKQAPYQKKADVDANYKKMVAYGCQKEHAQSVHLGVASHNLFDIAYALLLRAENQVEGEVNFEMLEGMADHMRRVVQRLSQDILLYCPVATKQDFQSAIAYLIRRLDENTGVDNFLRVTFGLTPHVKEWDEQVNLFKTACKETKTVYTHPRRDQNRLKTPQPLALDAPFENEADTDFSLPQNRKWIKEIVAKWHKCLIPPIPVVIAGQEIHSKKGQGIDPSNPNTVSYEYALASLEEIDKAISCAKAQESSWGGVSVKERCKLLCQVAQKMRERKGDLIGVMMRDGGKAILEADPEVSEAIDFAEYYLRELKAMEGYSSLKFNPKGTVLVTPPWNFPISIPAGGILAALAAGNCVLFKPAPEAVLSGFELVKLFWDAGIPKTVLQFISCEDEPVGSKLIADPRINSIILTGATSTAKLFMKLHPGVELHAETGGKNGIIVTALSDRDLAIKDIVSSAFGHSGQKCSACSLLVLEKEVYDDPHFLKQLKDAVESLTVGTCWNLSAKVTPLIRQPADALMKGFTQLEKGESWLVRPQVDPQNPHLWSPGVKIGVKRGSFSHRTEFFGPLLSVIRAKDLEEAIDIVNDTTYGLTSGLQSLDEREKRVWLQKIEVGNGYINRGITGAIVRRQPFGGTKDSSFGGGAKAGGPNYIMQFASCKELELPKERGPFNEAVNQLASRAKDLTQEEMSILYASLANYAYFNAHFFQEQDPSQIVGQDNLFRYLPYKGMAFRIQQGDSPLDIFRVLGACLTCGTTLDISSDKGGVDLEGFPVRYETEEEFAQKVREGKYKRVRLLKKPSSLLVEAASVKGVHLASAKVLAHGRIELLHYLREMALSIDYHRYGNLGLREQEKRSAIL